jgi:hypothetical protein
MEFSALGHISVGKDLDRINKEDPFWSSESSSPTKMKTLSFGTHQITKGDSGVTTDFACLKDGSNKTSFIFAKVIDAAFAKKPVHPFFSNPCASELEQLFKTTIASLERGEKVSLWDGQSTKIPVAQVCIEIVKTCFVKYNYFMDNSQAEPEPEPDMPDIADLEERLKKLMAASNFPPGPCTTTPLARSAPPTICGVPKIREDDLDARMERLLNLPNEVIYLAEPVNDTRPVNAFVIQ